MKKKLHHSFSRTHTSKHFNKKQFNLYATRLNKVNLIWCKQVIDFIQNFKIKSIKDIGCNYFQFYKELKLRKLKIKYFGYNEESTIFLMSNEFNPLKSFIDLDR